MRDLSHAHPFRSGAQTAADQTLERSITTQPLPIQPPPLPGRALGNNNIPRGSFSLMSSGPLSTRMVPDFPRHSMGRRVRIQSGGSFPRRRIKALDHMLGGQGKVDLDAEAFAVEIITNVQ